MSHAPSQQWDLESILPGGPGGEPFRLALQALKRRLEGLAERADALPAPQAAPEAWRELLLALDSSDEDLGQILAFTSCWRAADARSSAARKARAQAVEVYSVRTRATVPIQAGLAELDAAAFESFLGHPDLADLAPQLRHLREGARLELPRPLQELQVEMDREALHGWGQLYETLSGRLEATVALPGEPPRTLGIAALAALRADPDEATRRAAFEAAEGAWNGEGEVCAAALTHITGARQSRFDRVGVDELAHSLHRNRLTPQILEAMWAAADHALPTLVRCLHHKAGLLGKQRLDWWDLLAPLPLPEGTPGTTLTWEAAQDLVVDSFAGFSDELADFARHALRRRWVEAEARPGKAPGGFCARLPRQRESRIFMTFGGSLDTTLTLAHELGHAWHNEILFDVPMSRRNITSALAETASTFAEAVVRDQALSQAGQGPMRRFMLEQEVQAGVVFLMNIRARFTFERELFRLRREGPFDPAQLAEHMLAAQRTCYGDALATWDPTFWASKLHFYISHFGFYNWPYTFGYLFSGAIYQRAVHEGPSFLPTLKHLLRLTGYEHTLAIGREVLGADLEDPAFWIESTEPLLRTARAFLDER